MIGSSSSKGEGAAPPEFICSTCPLMRHLMYLCFP